MLNSLKPLLELNRRRRDTVLDDTWFLKLSVVHLTGPMWSLVFADMATYNQLCQLANSDNKDCFIWPNAQIGDFSTLMRDIHEINARYSALRRQPIWRRDCFRWNLHRTNFVSCIFVCDFRLLM
jgi:hypothetical protein